MMTTDPQLTGFSSRSVMAAQLADDIADVLARGVRDHGAAALALSGGATPADLYDALSRRDLDWSRITAALVDERWVAPGAAGSNETFVRNLLQRNRAATVNFIGMWSDALSPAAGLAAAQLRYVAVKTPFDVVVLGMGADGHTASWFPYAEGLGVALADSGARLAAVSAVKSEITGDHTERMTLTLGEVKDAGYVCLVITGREKRQVFERALAEGPVEDMPVRAILRARPEMRVCWAP